MGIDAGLKTVLVLSGESREEDLADTPFPPDYVFKSVAEWQRPWVEIEERFIAF